MLNGTATLAPYGILSPRLGWGVVGGDGYPLTTRVANEEKRSMAGEEFFGSVPSFYMHFLQVSVCRLGLIRKLNDSKSQPMSRQGKLNGVYLR